MDRDLEKKEGTTVQEKPDRVPKSRSKAAARARRRGRHQGYRIGAGIFLALALAAFVGGYVYRAMGYRNTFLPHTVINGTDVSGRTPQEAKALISAGVRNYSLVLKLKDGTSRRVSGGDIGLHAKFDGSLEEIIGQQNPYAWPGYLLKGPDYKIQTLTSFDEPALENELEKLDCFDPLKVTPPTDAYLSDYISGEGYSVVPETEGTEPDMNRVKTEAIEHVKTLDGEMDLEALDCYRRSSIRADNSSLAAARDARNRYVNITVTYTFGSTSQVLDGNTIHQWLVFDGDKVSLNSDEIADYIKELASKYNTAYKKRPFKTSYGQTVETSGVYGWRINQKAEIQELTEILESGKSTTKEPVYSQTAASHDGDDFGSTYAEVNLTAQHLFLYKDGQKILESDFVSGNIAKGHTTPPGIFTISYKQKDAVLKGQGYASPVKYWMPFNGGIGFHDASWRSSFGGAIYKSGGSHGCVNMPYGTAAQMFQNVYEGMPVICYYLPGTENSRSSKASGSAPGSGHRPPVHTAEPAAAAPIETPDPGVPPASDLTPPTPVPGETADPGASQTPGTQPGPGVPQMPGAAPGGSQTPGTQPGPGVPQTPGTQPGPGVSQTPGTLPGPGVPQTPGTQPATGASQTSDAPPAPGTPPAFGENPTPGASQVPGEPQPGASLAPGAPDQTKPQASIQPVGETPD